jgi:hypothetical protein
VKLQGYWKKICEDERKSRWRNEKLLHDFQRVESNMEEMHEKTEKLRLIKVTLVLI